LTVPYMHATLQQVQVGPRSLVRRSCRVLSSSASGARSVARPAEDRFVLAHRSGLLAALLLAVELCCIPAPAHCGTVNECCPCYAQGGWASGDPRSSFNCTGILSRKRTPMATATARWKVPHGIRCVALHARPFCACCGVRVRACACVCVRVRACACACVRMMPRVRDSGGDGPLQGGAHRGCAARQDKGELSIANGRACFDASRQWTDTMQGQYSVHTCVPFRAQTHYSRAQLLPHICVNVRAASGQHVVSTGKAETKTQSLNPKPQTPNPKP